jgi:hypothetical protein
MVSLVMAWSPFQRANAGIIGVEQPGDYANPIPTTSATGPFPHDEGAALEPVEPICLIIEKRPTAFAVSYCGKFSARIGIYSRSPAAYAVRPNLRRLLLDETQPGIVAARRTKTSSNRELSSD